MASMPSAKMSSTHLPLPPENNKPTPTGGPPAMLIGSHGGNKNRWISRSPLPRLPVLDRKARPARVLTGVASKCQFGLNRRVAVHDDGRARIGWNSPECRHPDARVRGCGRDRGAARGVGRAVAKNLLDPPGQYTIVVIPLSWV